MSNKKRKTRSDKGKKREKKVVKSIEIEEEPTFPIEVPVEPEIKKDDSIVMHITEDKKEELPEDTIIHVYELKTPIFVGSLYAAADTYLKETGLANEVNTLDFLDRIARAIGSNDPTLKLWIAQDMKDTTKIAGFMIVCMTVTPIFRVWIDALWQDKKYAKLNPVEELKKAIEAWCKELKIHKIFTIAQKESMARLLRRIGFEAKGILMGIDIELEE